MSMHARVNADFFDSRQAAFIDSRKNENLEDTHTDRYDVLHFVSFHDYSKFDENRF